MAGSFARCLARRASALISKPVPVSRSTGHVLKLREVERLLPFETALGEHLKHRFDGLRVIQAADRYEDRARKTFQVGGERPVIRYCFGVAQKSSTTTSGLSGDRRSLTQSITT